jgi:hypothetical protein
MRVKDARRSRIEASPRGFRTLGRFTLEATEGILIFDCRLIQAPDGRLLAYGPSSKTDAQILSMSAPVREHIITLASDALGFNNEDSKAA